MYDLLMVRNTLPAMISISGCALTLPLYRTPHDSLSAPGASSVTFHILFVQDPDKRPLITEVKDALLEFARLHFNSHSPAEAMALKHMKERALLDQILPPKVSNKQACKSSSMSGM